MQLEIAEKRNKLATLKNQLGEDDSLFQNMVDARSEYQKAMTKFSEDQQSYDQLEVAKTRYDASKSNKGHI